MADRPAGREGLDGRPILGDAAMLAAMALLPMSDALSKMMTAEYSPEQIAWFRNLVHAGIVVPLAWRGGGRPVWDALHLVRSFAFAMMTVLYIAALFWMPLADAQAVFFTFPLIVMGWSVVALDHRLGALRWLAAGAGLSGLAMVVQPGLREISPGVGLALLAALFGAVHVLATRRVSGGTPPMALLAMPALFSAIALAPAVPWRWVTPDAGDLAILGAIGVLSAGAHLLLVVAYARAFPSTIVPLAYLQIMVGVLLGWWIFDDLPDALGVAGITMIVLSGIVIAIRERNGRAEG